jgi:hypothetical protein
MEVSGQLHAPTALPPRERAPGTHWIGGWVGPRAVLDTIPPDSAQLPCDQCNIECNDLRNTASGTEYHSARSSYLLADPVIIRDDCNIMDQCTIHVQY